MRCWHRPRQGVARGVKWRVSPQELGVGLPLEAPCGCTWVGVSSSEMSMGPANQKTVREEKEMKSLLSIDEAALELGICRTTLYSLLDAPHGVRTTRIGRRRLVAACEITQFVERSLEPAFAPPESA